MYDFTNMMWALFSTTFAIATCRRKWQLWPRTMKTYCNIGSVYRCTAYVFPTFFVFMTVCVAEAALYRPGVVQPKEEEILNQDVWVGKPNDSKTVISVGSLLSITTSLVQSARGLSMNPMWSTLYFFNFSSRSFTIRLRQYVLLVERSVQFETESFSIRAK